MMNMLIKLDEEKIKRDGVYTVKELWDMIDGITGEFPLDKEVLPDGAVMYNGRPDADNFTSCSCSYIGLSSKEWFARYVSKWIWYDNDDDESLPYQDYDLIASEKKEKNPLFLSI